MCRLHSSGNANFTLLFLLCHFYVSKALMVLCRGEVRNGGARNMGMSFNQVCGMSPFRFFGYNSSEIRRVESARSPVSLKSSRECTLRLAGWYFELWISFCLRSTLVLSLFLWCHKWVVVAAVILCYRQHCFSLELGKGYCLSFVNSLLRFLGTEPRY